MEWLNEPNTPEPGTPCMLHFCWANEDNRAYCFMRICATRFCLWDFSFFGASS